jgi:hypothetical protein
VYRKQGGNELVVASGGTLTIEAGGIVHCDGGYTADGITKLRNRPTTDAYALEVKTEYTGTAALHWAITSTADWHPTTAAATGSGIQGLQGVGRLAASHSMTGGSIVGTYGQVCNLGTVNGSGITLAGVYGLIEDGGVYTAVSHVAAGWFDSHLSQAVTAGKSELLYMSNNGSTTLGQAIYIYAGNKTTNLFSIEVASGMVSADNAGGSTLNFTNWKTIKIELDGQTHYLVAAKTIA